MVENVDESPAAPTTEQLAAYKKAFSAFQEILTVLITEAREITVTDALPEDRSVMRRLITSLKRFINQLITSWNRLIDRVPEYENLLARYTIMLPNLERADGQEYSQMSQMALLGIKALQTRKLEVAKTVHAELLFLTASSETLKSVLKGLGISVIFFLIIILVLPTLFIAAALSYGLSRNSMKDYYSTNGMHVYVAFCFGCLGSVISFLTRLSAFDSKQARSRNFLFVYGLTLPIVGGGSAIVIAAALDAGILRIMENRTLCRLL